MERSTIFHGNSHYFDWAVFNSYVKLPEGIVVCNLYMDIYRVGGWATSWNIVNGKDDIPYMKWKIQFMFETTKQLKYFINYPSNYGFPMLSPSFHVRNKQIPSSHPSKFTVLQDDLQDFTQGEELHTAFLGQLWANRRIAAVLMGKNMGKKLGKIKLN